MRAATASHAPPAARVVASDLVANPALQDAIARSAHAKSKADIASTTADLRRLSAADFSDLVPQLAIFVAGAKDGHDATTPTVVVSRLGITRGQILRAVEPHLGTSDPALRAQLANLLAVVDRGPGGVGGVNFYEVAIFLGEKGRVPSLPLVRYLFERSAPAAVTVLAQVEKGAPGAPDVVPAEVSVIETRRSELAAGEKLSPDAREDAVIALQTMSQSPDWWLRCYAAAVVRAEPTLAGGSDPILRARLSADPDARVRAVLEAPAVRRG